MEKTIALDLGTNSIGWAIREGWRETNQITKWGVLTFEKGVATVKGNEKPKVSDRTERRGKRRNYQARKYRKQYLLQLLIENGMCPLSIEDLNSWRKYSKGRSYPKCDEFKKWLQLDFDGDGKADYINPYILRSEIVNGNVTSAFVIGRALYHLTQRRGYKASNLEDPKEAQSIHKGSDEKGTKGHDEIKHLLDNNSTIGSVYATFDRYRDRIRNRYNLRTDIDFELRAICGIADIKLESELFLKLQKAIVWQRPLRTQKGNVGPCTLEKGKVRCQVSHPLFELYRAFGVINNIKIKPKGSSSKDYKFLTSEQRTKVFDEVFMRKEPDFDFIDISKKLDKKGEFDFNYRNNQNVSGCPVSSYLRSIFGVNWRNIKVDKAPSLKSKKDFYDLEDIWHVLNTFTSKEKIEDFARNKLFLNEDQLKLFVTLFSKMPNGYSSLSLNAIKKILPHLETGSIYSEAVLSANLNAVFGRSLSIEELGLIQRDINKATDDFEYEKEINNIANILIAEHLGLPHYEKFYADETYSLDDADKTEIEQKLISNFGEQTWDALSIKVREDIRSNVSRLYLTYLQNSSVNSKDKFVKTQRKDDRVKDILRVKYGATDDGLKLLYHHSSMEIYPVSKEDSEGRIYLQSPIPPSKGFKNPMAMKTLYKLKYLINYLIKIGQIDDETKVIVEVPRELTSANKRSAYEKWQRDRQAENREFARAIIEIANEKHMQLNPENPENIDKFRLWYDQLSNRDEVYKKVTVLKNDIDKYRLWKEQECRCMYTGKVISLSELFIANKFDFEHTIPASISFDDSLANLTVCDSVFNQKIKGKQIPSKLANYHADAGGFTAIEPRLVKWQEKVEELKDSIKEYTRKAKYASTKEIKDACIQKRHYYEFELEYWGRKLWTFTTNEFKVGWRNSQLVDTGIVSKYAFHYLKTAFNKVYVQKGDVTAIFRKVYQIQGQWQTKSRDKHSHHAMDAAILTLIPTGFKREKILEQYFQANEEQNKNFHSKPYPGFDQSEIKKIEDNTLINFLTEDRALLAAKKYVRERGKRYFERDKNGNKQFFIATGDTVRGQLHKETFFGAIKEPLRDENNKMLRNEDMEILQKNEVKYVVRKLLRADELGFTAKDQLKKIVDPIVREKVLAHVGDRSLKEAFSETIWMNKEKGIKIRHVRVFKDDVSEPLEIKKHRDLNPQKDYKHFFYAENATNYIYAFYEGAVKGVIKRGYELVNLFDASKNRNIEMVPLELAIDKKKEVMVPLRAKLRVGQRVLFYKDHPEELSGLDSVLSRLYRIYKFEKDGRINFQFHLEARSDSELRELTKEFGASYANGFTSIDFEKSMPRLRLSVGNLQMLIEDVDFMIQPNGQVEFK